MYIYIFIIYIYILYYIIYYIYYIIYIRVYINNMGLSQNSAYGSARADPDACISLDHLRFGLDQGYGSGCTI